MFLISTGKLHITSLFILLVKKVNKSSLCESELSDNTTKMTDFKKTSR